MSRRIPKDWIIPLRTNWRAQPFQTGTPVFSFTPARSHFTTQIDPFATNSLCVAND
jgi:hypothetical protein